MPELPPHYHVGIVVTDLESARDRLGQLLGITWGPVMHLDDVSYRDGFGTDLMLPTTMCYSTGDPCIELIEEQPGTVWIRNEHSNLHHLGFWSEDLAGDSALLATAGCPLQLCGRIMRPLLCPSPTTATRLWAFASSWSMPRCLDARSDVVSLSSRFSIQLTQPAGSPLCSVEGETRRGEKHLGVREVEHQTKVREAEVITLLVRGTEADAAGQRGDGSSHDLRHEDVRPKSR